MAITGTWRQDTSYPMLGDTVTLAVDGTPAGRRVRWRVSSVPVLSALEPYDDHTPEAGWLRSAPSNGAVLEPDTHGVFSLVAVEEEYQPHLPHFAGDPSSAVEEWTEVAMSDVDVYVGARETLSVGDERHTATLTVHAIAAGAFSQGVITAWHDVDRAPALSDPSDDEATIALAETRVVEVLTFYGGAGYVGDDDLIEVLGYICETPGDLMGRLALGFNQHIGYTTNGVHTAADAANTMGGVAVPTDEPTLVAYVNTFATKMAAHAALGVGTHPNGADAAFALTSPVATDLASSITRYLDLRTQYSNHRVRCTTVVHDTPGDAQVDAREPWQQPIDADTPLDDVIDYAVALATAYDVHLSSTTIAAAYHANADADNTVTARTVQNTEDLIQQVNEFADYLEAHATNYVGSTHAAAALDYHASPDYGCKVPTRANDRASAITTLRYCLWAYMHHLDVDGTWHGGANGGKAWVGPASMTDRVQVEILKRLAGETTGTPPNTMTAINDLVDYGGFEVST